MALNQLEEIEKLYSKPKEYKIPLKPKQGELQTSINIRSLAMDEMSYFDIKPEETLTQQSETISKLIAISLDISVEQSKKLSVGILMDLMEGIMDANNLDDVEKSDKIGSMKKFIEAKKNQNESRTSKPIEG